MEKKEHPVYVDSPNNRIPSSTNSGFYYEEDGKRKLVERHGDIRMCAEVDTYSIIFAEETQNKVHYGMAVRTMLYEALEYEKQLHAIENKYKKQKIKLSGDEFLSKMKKEDRLTPVVTIIFYCKADKEWDGARSLYEMLHINEDMPGYEKIKGVLNDFRLNIVQVDDVENVKKFKTNLQHIFAMLKLNTNKKQLNQYIINHKDEMKTMDSVEKQAAIMLLGEQKEAESLLASLSDEEKEEVNMGSAFFELLKDYEDRGMQIGMERSILELLEEIGDISDEIRERLSNETNFVILTKWLKLAAKSESIEQFVKNM